MTTRNKIAEQVERLYMRSFDREDLKPKIERREVMLLIDQAANELLGMQQQAAARIGIVDVPTCMIARYRTQSATQVTPFTTTLPAFPIQLPMDMGVWSIKSSAGVSYIPIKTEFWDLMGGLDEGLLEDQVGFYVRGRTVTFTRIPTATVDIELLIVDPALLGEFDPYPIPADLEIKVVERVLALIQSRGLAPEKPKG
jgi:hypothetical protein